MGQERKKVNECAMISVYQVYPQFKALRMIAGGKPLPCSSIFPKQFMEIGQGFRRTKAVLKKQQSGNRPRDCWAMRLLSRCHRVKWEIDSV